MPSPHGYRTALRLMQLAEKFYLPVVTLVDTVGAWPTFQCEVSGQSEAIATNLTLMAGLKVPIVTGTAIVLLSLFVQFSPLLGPYSPRGRGRLRRRTGHLHG
jgi:hypothetical protein